MARRASGRRAYNCRRQHQARLRQREVLHRFLKYSIEGETWGVKAKIARELGVHRSTVGRDLEVALRRLNDLPDPPRPERDETTAQFIKALGPLMERETPAECDCEEEERDVHPKHELLHLLDWAGEIVTAIDFGEIEATEEDREVALGIAERLAALVW